MAPTLTGLVMLTACDDDNLFRIGDKTGHKADASSVVWAPDATIVDAMRDGSSDVLEDASNRDVPPGEDGSPPVESCTSRRTVFSERTTRPTDILWVVDTSPTMQLETATVRDNLNLFSQRIEESGIDFHVILIADATVIAVAPPLGDSDRFLHVNQIVTSTSALADILDQYGAYKAMLREGSVKNLVVVSDDDSEMPAATFATRLNRLTDPGFTPQWIFHSIVAYGDVFQFGCATGAAVGEEYLALTALSGGVAAPVCETDWAPIFTAIETAVILSSMACEIAVPDIPEGKSVDPSVAEVSAQDDTGLSTLIPRVDGLQNCAQGGWYFDNPTAPTRFLLCAVTCNNLRQRPGVSMQVSIGCHDVAPPG
jgi:hypothetical protein